MTKSFFRSLNIDVINALSDPHKLGYDVIRNLIKYNFKGDIYSANKHVPEILRLQCYATVKDLPEGL